MAFAYIDCDPVETGVEWLRLESVCPTNKEKELLRARVTGLTEGLAGGGYFDQFQLRKNLLNEKQIGSEIIYRLLQAVTGPFETVVFGATVEAQIVACHIVPAQNITGSNSDYMTLKLVNKETGNVICTKTFLAGVDASAWEVCNFGPVNEEASHVNLTKGVSLVKEDTGTGMILPVSLLIVEWNLG